MCCYYPESQHLENKSLFLPECSVSWNYFHKYRDITASQFRLSQSLLENTPIIFYQQLNS